MTRDGDTYMSHGVMYIVKEENGLFKALSIRLREPITNWMSERNMSNFLKDPNNNLKQVSAGE